MDERKSTKKIPVRYAMEKKSPIKYMYKSIGKISILYSRRLLYLSLNLLREDAVFELPHELVSLLCKCEGEYLSSVSISTLTMGASVTDGTYRVRQDSGKVREISLVHGEYALGLDGPVQTVER